MATLDAKSLNQNKFKYRTVFSVKFDKQDGGEQMKLNYSLI